jgi:hypothetical protein
VKAVRSAQWGALRGLRRSLVGVIAGLASIYGSPLPAQVAVRYQELVGKLGDPITLVRSGQYKSAIEVLSAIPKNDSGWAAAQPMLINALATIGKYDEAERAGREAVAM